MQYRVDSLPTQLRMDLASGQVLHSLPGMVCLPIRLAEEVFERCLHALGQNSSTALFDPCCGGAYHLAVLALLRPGSFGTVIASDVDPRAVETAARNLALTSVTGMRKRASEIENLASEFGKASHAESVLSARRLLERLEHAPTITTRTAVGDAAVADDVKRICGEARPDVVLADIPYGNRSVWRSSHAANPLEAMLSALRHVLASPGVVCIISDKRQKPHSEWLTRRERFTVGRRLVTLFVNDGSATDSQERSETGKASSTHMPHHSTESRAQE